MLVAYGQLRNLTSDPSAQGATQVTSALRYLLALDQFTKKNDRACNTREKSDKDEFSKYVGEVVAVNDSCYTANFYNAIKESSDYSVGSNFFSVNVVKSSLENTSKEYSFPRKGNSLFLVQNGELIESVDYLSNIDFYLSDDLLKSAFAVWLTRNSQIDTANVYKSIRETLLEKYSSELLSALLPVEENFSIDSPLQFSDSVAEFQRSDFPLQNVPEKKRATSILPPDELITKVRESFIRYWRIIDQHGADYENYVKDFEETLNPLLSELNLGYSNIFEIIDIEAYNWIINEIILKYPKLSYISAGRQNTGTKYVVSSTHIHYKNYLEILAISDFRANIDSMKDELQAPMMSNEYSLQQIFYGAPGTGKSHTIKEMCSKYKNFRTTFHPDTDYSSFVGSYKPITQKVPVYGIQGTLLRDENGKAIYEDRIVYRYVFQAFLQAYIAAWLEQQNEQPKPVFLIVEEINRGNCAQIFGDIFQLLDRNEAGFSDYPIVADQDLEQELRREFDKLAVHNAEAINSQFLGDEDVVAEVKQGKKLLLPGNLYIWATMNTSDQSLFPIDSAFKRRWDWNYIKIKDAGKNYKIKFSNGHTYDWWQFVEAINKRIEGGDIQQEDKKLGYFFAKARNGEISAKTFLSKVIFYLYNDVFKDFGLEEDFFKDEAGQTMTFASYFGRDGSIDESRVELFISNLGLTPDSEDTADTENDTAFPGLYVGDKKIKPITDAVIAILTEAAKQHTYAEIEQAVARIPRKADPVIKTIDNPDGYEGENRWNKTVVYDRDGQPFVVSNQWHKEEIPAIKEVAAQFGIETRDAEE